MSTMGHLGSASEAHGLVARVMDACAAGSYLALNEGLQTETTADGVSAYNSGGAAVYNLRTPDEVASYFDMVEPGLVRTPQWRPELYPEELPADLENMAGVATSVRPRRDRARVAPASRSRGRVRLALECCAGPFAADRVAGGSERGERESCVADVAAGCGVLVPAEAVDPIDLVDGAPATDGQVAPIERAAAPVAEHGQPR